MILVVKLVIPERVSAPLLFPQKESNKGIALDSVWSQQYNHFT
jgi:hypothetical protein